MRQGAKRIANTIGDDSRRFKREDSAQARPKRVESRPMNTLRSHFFPPPSKTGTRLAMFYRVGSRKPHSKPKRRDADSLNQSSRGVGLRCGFDEFAWERDWPLRPPREPRMGTESPLDRIGDVFHDDERERGWSRVSSACLPVRDLPGGSVGEGDRRFVRAWFVKPEAVGSAGGGGGIRLLSHQGVGLVGLLRSGGDRPGQSLRIGLESTNDSD